jgi:uncharacterized membrane protein
MTAKNIISAWNDAVSNFEQIPFAIPLTPEALSNIILVYSMEPSAKATLYQLCCKIFGQATFEQYLLKD